MKRCIECGIEYDENIAWKNPYWCPKCDKERRERITKKLHYLVDEMKEEIERKEQ